MCYLVGVAIARPDLTVPSTMLFGTLLPYLRMGLRTVVTMERLTIVILRVMESLYVNE